MKKRFPAFLVLIATVLVNCTAKIETKSSESYKEEILNAEKDFEKTVAEKGIAEGFYQFADSNAIIKRENDTLIIGKENIKHYYSNPKYQKAAVTWSPDFINVSESGDMAYTYGKYNWTVTDSLGQKRTFKGIFHTVWKRQANGNWKYVWD